MSTLYFAWVDPTETTFGPQHHRVDEEVVKFKREIDEGEFPALTAVVRNPQIGLLAPGRKTWAWFSYLDDTGHVWPLLLGQLVGIPTDMLGAVVTLRFLARSRSYISDKQIVAEGLKVRPYWDPVFIDLTKRDDPDAILEGYSKRWHHDPVTLISSVSDVLIGEDGTATFQQTDVIFESVQVRLGQQPLLAVAVDATVSWTQESIGIVDIGKNSFQSYSGDGIISDWPKPGASIGGGWSCFAGLALDVFNVRNAITGSYSNTWQNTDTDLQDGDNLSISYSATVPLAAGHVLNIYSYNFGGLLDPFAVDIEGDPAPVNIPAYQTHQYSLVPLWTVSTSLQLRYDAKRKRTEHLTFLVQSDLQPILNLPTVAQYSELIQKNGQDVGVPIYNFNNWSAIAGQAVTTGQYIFPDNPLLPGQTSTQVCTTAGTTGLVEPAFSMIEGETTVDGTAVWTSLGTSPPPTLAPDWAQQTNTPLGDIIIPRVPLWVTWKALTAPYLDQLLPVGAAISLYQIVQASNGSYQICVLAGTTGLVEPAFPATWGLTTLDGNAMWESLGNSLPNGSTAFICTTAGETGTVLPPFNSTQGATTTDSGVVWTSLGAVETPIGGYPGNTTAPSYFPSTRGLWSLEYLIAVARAKLRARARAVNITFACRFELAVALTCRMNAEIFDFRLPGGMAGGKIISCEISGDGDKGQLIGKVTIGCSIGLATVIHDNPGDPTYAAPGYMAVGYQYFANANVLIDENEPDIAYTPPASSVTDDGLVFPLTKSQVVVFEGAHGTLLEQELALNTAGGLEAAVALLQHTNTASTLSNSILLANAGQHAGAYGVGYQLQQHPIWYDLRLKPVANGPFGAEYHVTVSNLSVPKTIDLQAPSS